MQEARKSPARADLDDAGKLARKRLQDFAALFARAMIEDDPKTVHDLRVASRRLQQLLRGLASAKSKKSSKKASNVLRKIRQALGPLRNLDVMAELINARVDSAANDKNRAAWLEIKSAIEEERELESARVQESLKDYDLTEFLDRTRRAMKDAADERANVAELTGIIERRFQSWSEALADVGAQPSAKRLHRLRIAGKRLRYSVELSAALTDPKLKTLARALAQLQDNLGAWHDMHTLMQYVAAYIDQQDFVSERPKDSRALLAEMERERKRSQAQADEAVAAAETLRAGWPIKSVEPTD